MNQDRNTRLGRIFHFGYCVDGEFTPYTDCDKKPASEPVAQVGARIHANFYVRNAHDCYSFDFSGYEQIPFGYWRFDEDGQPLPETFMVCGILHAKQVSSGSLSGWKCRYEEFSSPVNSGFTSTGAIKRPRDNSPAAIKARIRARKKARKKAAYEAAMQS